MSLLDAIGRTRLIALDHLVPEGRGREQEFFPEGRGEKDALAYLP